MLIRADARHLPLRDESVQMCVTSPPYWGLRDYGTAKWEGGDNVCTHQKPNNNAVTTTMTGGTATLEKRHFFRDECGLCGAVRIDRQLGLEATPEEYVANMVAVFQEVRRVMRKDGVLWLNLGDSYFNANLSPGGDGFKSGLRKDGGDEEPRIRSEKPSISRQAFSPLEDIPGPLDSCRQSVEVGGETHCENVTGSRRKGLRHVHIIDLTYHDLAKKRTSVTPAMGALLV